MNKMNKKGFTLIEMLVVIAIIAVLVSIIIPTVTSATDKAAAAANAANLRSIKAEIVTAYLTNDTTNYTFGEGGVITPGDNSSAKTVDWKEVKSAFITSAGITAADNADATDGAFYAKVEDDVITVYYDQYTIASWAKMAGGKPGATEADE